jgi:OOP family OmpA-OmpF porin
MIPVRPLPDGRSVDTEVRTMSQRVLRLVILFASLALASAAHAEVYVGAAFMQSDAEFESAVDDFDADDSSFKVFGGYNFAKWFGLEVAYRDFGTFEDSTPLGAVDADLEGLDLSARGILPLGNLVGIFAKVGYANIQYDVDFDTVTDDFDDDEWELLYGAGIDVYLGKHFGLRGEWEMFDVDDQLNSLSAGAFFRF